MSSVTAFPLAWPVAYPRTRNRATSKFKSTSFEVSRTRLFAQLRILGGTQIVLSTNIPIRNDGFPYSDLARRRIDDPGVAVYFQYRGKQRVLACDRWRSTVENLHALELTVDAMRGLERWGASSILERAFTGFTALPAPEQWFDVLGIAPNASIEQAECEYRERMKSAHPDRGGSDGRAAKLNWAIEQARRELQ